MDRILYDGKSFEVYEYSEEKEFEKHVIAHARQVFGERSVYVDIKKRIGEDNILTIPDGYLVDFSIEAEPRLYIIENELVTHDPYKHIGQQLLKFAISYKISGRNIKNFLLNHIIQESSRRAMVEQWIAQAGYRNIDALLEDLIFEKPVGAIVIIDEVNSDLESVLSQLTMPTDVLEFQTFCCGSERLHKFTPFHADIKATGFDGTSPIKPSEMDTVVVPANEDGFKEVFLGQNCWWAIRISSAMLDRIKYIAAYQTAPVSAITYYAEVSKIEKYKSGGKYILHFKDKAKGIGPIPLATKKYGAAPQGPRYTSVGRLLKAKTLSEVFSGS